MTTVVKIATRGSQLALWQARYVASLLEQIGLKSELKIIKTEGDRVQNRFLHEIGGKGLFVRELESAMLAGEVDIAVHSLKDLPAKLSEEFDLAAILKRHNPADAIIFRDEPYEKLSLPSGQLSLDHFRSSDGLVIATSSLRRQSLFKSVNSNIELVPVRGNVDTRIKKLQEGTWDALILAAASLERLEIEHVPFRIIDPEWFVPCAAQGALAIECLKDHPLHSEIAKLKDPVTYECATVERKILEELGGDCTMPFGAYISSVHDHTEVRSLVLNYEGETARSYKTYDKNILDLDHTDLVKDALAGLKEQNLEKILKDISVEPPSLGELH